MAKRMIEKSEEHKSHTVINIIITLIFLTLVTIVFYYSPNYIKENYNGKTKILINNNNVTLKMKKDIYIDENNNIFLSIEDIKNYFDKHINYNKSTGEIITTSEINIAKMKKGEKKLDKNGEEVELNSSTLEKEGTVYLPFSEISEKVYDVDLKYIKDTNTIIIDSLDRKQETAKIVKDTKMRYKPQELSRNIEKLEKDEKVVYIETNNDWAKIRGKDGEIGYVKKECIGDIETLRENKEYIKKVDGKVNLVWDYFSEYANVPDRSTEKLEGVNVMSPAFFSLMKQSDGDIYDNAQNGGKEYIEWAHNNGYQVWAMFANNSLKDTTSAILNDYNKREYMIENLLKLVQEYNVDGINVDFENMNADDKDKYSRFLIELAPRLKILGKTLSVDVTAPDGSETWSLCFDRKTIADVSDYVIFMGYDQYGVSATKAGTTAGYDWVATNVNKFLGQEDVDADKMILGMPLYMRLWKEDANGKVTSKVVNMKNMLSTLPSNQVANWNDELKQYYVEYKDDDGSTYKMWIENEKSISEKINLAKEKKLAGIAFWAKDRETNDDFWSKVKEELNK